MFGYMLLAVKSSVKKVKDAVVNLPIIPKLIVDSIFENIVEAAS